MKEYINFKDKAVVITGGRRGLGKAMALGFAEAGADIVVISRSETPGDVKEKIEKIGRRFHYIQADLSDRKQREGIIKKAHDAMGRIDVLINNAGIQNIAPVEDYDLDMWDIDMSVLLTACFDLSKQASVIMQKQNNGKIILMASISSFLGARNIIAYSTAKHAIVGLTKCLANELAPHNINVNAIAPGIFETDMARCVWEDKERSATQIGRIPAGKFGKPEDIVGPALFLASDMSRHVHGHVLVVDGGCLGR